MKRFSGIFAAVLFAVCSCGCLGSGTAEREGEAETVLEKTS